MRWLLGDLTTPEARAAFVDRVELAQEILRRLVALVKVVLTEDVRRRGVDPARLIVEVTADVPGRPEPPVDGPS